MAFLIHNPPDALRTILIIGGYRKSFLIPERRAEENHATGTAHTGHVFC